MTACTSDRCRQGHAPCPTPQACQVAEAPAVQYAPAEKLRDSVEQIGKWVIGAIVVLSVITAAAMATGYLSVRL